MPTPFESSLPGHCVHVVQRGSWRAACFFCERDHLVYLQWLAWCAVRYQCAVHAYVLMGNHVHLLVTPSTADGVARLMRALAQRHARHSRDAHGRDSALRAGRVDVAPVYLKRHVLACMRYIERNPVHAGLVEWPGRYRWSSYRANAFGWDDPVVTPHPFYYALGRSPEARRAAYRAFCGGLPATQSTSPRARARPVKRARGRARRR